MTSLANAILEEKLEQIYVYLQNRVDVNELDEYGFTPLIEAAIADNTEIAKLLLGYGADPNLQDMTGGTALHWAAENNNMTLARLLLKRGANPNAYTFAGQPVMTMPLLRGQQPFKKLLQNAGANLTFTQDYVNAKLLGHMFELVGTADILDPNKHFVELNFEGFYLEFSLAMIAESLYQFKNNFGSRQVRRYEKYTGLIVDVINRAASLAKYQQYRVDISKHDDVINTLLQQEPLLIPVGYEGHAITFIKAGNVLVKCDRREESRLYDNIVFYFIENLQEMSVDFIKNLIYVKQSSEYINEGLPAILQLKPITELKVTAQISGNCSWANVEASIPALFFLLFSEAKDFHEAMSKYKNMAISFFQQWREWNKTRALDFCIQSFKESDPIRKACKAEILAAILFQSCKDNQREDADRIQSILDILATPQYEYVIQNYIKVYCYEDLGEEGKNFLSILKKYGYQIKKS
jgi:hypothetical protein